MCAEDAMRERYDRMYSQYSATGPDSEMADEDDDYCDKFCSECGQFEYECICDLEEDDDVLAQE
jgi:hypothetical protein